ncbi:hypothetical protein Tco_1465869, partial [Tanacetum coccineum]
MLSLLSPRLLVLRMILLSPRLLVLTNHDATITPTPRALEQNASEPSSKTRASSQTHEKKHQPGNRCAKSVPYRNIPRMINLQLQELQIRCGTEEEIQEVKLLIPLFEKVLIAADTGKSRLPVYRRTVR